MTSRFHAIHVRQLGCELKRVFRYLFLRSLKGDTFAWLLGTRRSKPFYDRTNAWP